MNSRAVSVSARRQETYCALGNKAVDGNAISRKTLTKGTRFAKLYLTVHPLVGAANKTLAFFLVYLQSDRSDKSGILIWLNSGYLCRANCPAQSCNGWKFTSA